MKYFFPIFIIIVIAFSGCVALPGEPTDPECYSDSDCGGLDGDIFCNSDGECETCPVVKCAAPPEDCVYVPDNSAKCPGCGTLECEEQQEPTPTCTDGKKNGQETGIDCGGPDCSACNTQPTDKKWELIGPGGGGWFRDVEFHTQNPDIVYLVGDRSGFYRSEDGGRTWLTKSDGIRNFAVEDIAVHPTNGDIVLIATNGGIHKSTNKGDTWEVKLDDAFDELSRDHELTGGVNGVHFHNTNPNVAFAAGGRVHYNVPKNPYAYVSTDMGETWTKSTNGLPITSENFKVYNFASPHDNENVVYLATSKGLYKSTNKGQSWTRTSHTYDTMDVVVDPEESNKIYVVDKWRPLGIFKSEDYGATWKQIANKNNGFYRDAGFKEGDGSNFYEIEFNPENPDELYVCTYNKYPPVFKTTNEGETWEPLGVEISTAGEDQRGWRYDWGLVASTFSVHGDRIIIGPRLFLSEDKGKTWDFVYTKYEGDGYYSGTGHEIMVYYQILLHPSIPNKFYAILGDTTMFHAVNNGDLWKHYHNLFDIKDSQGRNTHSAFKGAFDPEDEDIMYVAVGAWKYERGEIAKTTNNGESWKIVSKDLPSQVITSLVILDGGTKDSRTMLTYVNRNGLYRSTNSGVNWKKVSGLDGSGGVITVDEKTNTIYAVATHATKDARGIWKSTDRGATWTQLHKETIISPTTVEVDPNNSDILWVTQRDVSHYKIPEGIWKSVNGGDSFEKVFTISSDENQHTREAYFSWIEVDPRDSNIVYASTNDIGIVKDIWEGAGVYVTRDGGETWTPMNEGLYHGSIRHMVLDPKSGYLYVGTDGHGAYRYKTTV